MNTSVLSRSVKPTGGRAAAAGLGAVVALALVAAFSLVREDPAPEPGSMGAPPGARTSFAVGLSAGMGLREVLPVSVPHFEQGLRDALGGEFAAAGVMARSELFARMRQVTKAVAAAELEEISQRLDQEFDR